jgi:hypothetical protein
MSVLNPLQLDERHSCKQSVLYPFSTAQCCGTGPGDSPLPNLEVFLLVLVESGIRDYQYSLVYSRMLFVYVFVLMLIDSSCFVYVHSESPLPRQSTLRHTVHLTTAYYYFLVIYMDNNTRSAVN